MSDGNNYFSRKNRLLRRAQRLAGIEDVSKVISNTKRAGKNDLTTQNAGARAVTLVRDVLDQYHFPSSPKLGYSGVRKIRTAADSSNLEDGVLTITASFKTMSGVNVEIDIPVEIRCGELLEPSIIVHNGQPRIIAQSSFDAITSDNTLYEEPPLRDMYSAPFDREQHKALSDNRFRVERLNRGMFSVNDHRAMLKNAMRGLPLTAQVEPDPDATKPGGSQPRRTPPPPRITTTPPQTPGQKMEYGKEMFKVPENMPVSQDQFAFERGDQFNTYTEGQPVQQNPADVGLPRGSTFEEGQPVSFDVSGITMQGTIQSFGEPCKGIGCMCGGSGTQVQVRELRTDDVYDVCSDDLVGQKSAAKDDEDDSDSERPELDRNDQDLDYLDPAERKDDFNLMPGMEVSTKETLEIKDRGGSTYDISKGTKCKILKDLAGDNKNFVVRFEDGLEAIVERHFLKGAAQKAPKPPKQEKIPKPKKQNKFCAKCNSSPCRCHRKKSDIRTPGEQDLISNPGTPAGHPNDVQADSDLTAKVNEEVNSMREDGFTDIDVKEAVRQKYGEQMLNSIFHKTAP